MMAVEVCKPTKDHSSSFIVFWEDILRQVPDLAFVVQQSQSKETTEENALKNKILLEELQTWLHGCFEEKWVVRAHFNREEKKLTLRSEISQEVVPTCLAFPTVTVVLSCGGDCVYLHLNEKRFAKNKDPLGFLDQVTTGDEMDVEETEAFEMFFLRKKENEKGDKGDSEESESKKQHRVSMTKMRPLQYKVSREHFWQSLLSNQVLFCWNKVFFEPRIIWKIPTRLDQIASLLQDSQDPLLFLGRQLDLDKKGKVKSVDWCGWNVSIRVKKTIKRKKNHEVHYVVFKSGLSVVDVQMILRVHPNTRLTKISIEYSLKFGEEVMLFFQSSSKKSTSQKESASIWILRKTEMQLFLAKLKEQGATGSGIGVDLSILQPRALSFPLDTKQKTYVPIDCLEDCFQQDEMKIREKRQICRSFETQFF